MKKIILSLLFVLLIAQSHAQNAADFQNLVPVSTASPNSVSLGKFGNIPVSYATGVPSVTIPLYEITAGSIKLPLSLDYHGSGVRVDEISSSVGTSWALSGIPQITRTMIGLPDEISGGYLSNPSIDSLYQYYLSTTYGRAKDSTFAGVITGVRDGQNETEPDVFSYTINGASGKFMYRPNGSIIQIPVTNNRIERTSGNNFKITDAGGTVYFFDQQEQTQTVSASALPGTYATGWRVSKILAPNLTDTVYFKYTTVTGTTEHFRNFTYALGSIPVVGPLGTISMEENSGEQVQISTLWHTVELVPNEIDWRGGRILFKNVADRTDRQEESRLDSVKVYSGLNGAFQLIKSAKLHQSYFYSNPINGSTPDNRNYRLRLDSVAFLPVSGSFLPQTYQMTYNTTPIGPNESFAQDMWGYNNGAFTNRSLMPLQTVLWRGVYLTIGESSLEPDSNNTFIQACMLQSIRYPTKGKSVFTFEPHKYPLNYKTTQQHSVSCDAYGSVQSTNSTTFTTTATQSVFSYRVVLSAYNYSGVTDRPRVIMVDQTTGQTIFQVSNVSNPSQAYDTGTLAISLTTGHTYVITTNIYTADSRVQATCLVSWAEPVSGTTVKTGGGLRVSSITNYDLNGRFVNKELYQYGSDGTGSLLTAANFLLLNFERTFYQIGYTIDENANVFGGGPLYLIAQSDSNLVYHCKSVLPAAMLAGSPVAYSKVTKFDVDSTGLSNGKTVYEYNVLQDQVLPALSDPVMHSYGSRIDSTVVGIYLISNIWKNGIISRESAYKSSGSSYVPVSIKSYNYQVYRADSENGLKVKPLYIKLGRYLFPDLVNTRVALSGNDFGRLHYFLTKVPMNTGAMLLQSETDTTFDDAGNKLVTIKNNYYDDLAHIFPTKTEAFNSKSEALTNVIKYPHDLASGTNVYQKMLNRNIVSPTVSFQQLKNGTQLALANINYNDWFGNNNLLMPQTVDEQVLSAPIETRTKFNKYDAYGNILEQQKTNAPVSGYKWGYYSQYPIAVAANAASTEFYYEGFEESTAANVVAGTAHTGLRFYNGADTVSWTRPNARSYVISYWYRNSSGVWQYQPETAYAASTYALTGGTAYDDIRIYPADAQLATYTYLPLVGMTSSTDAKGMTTYYEYDGFQRLQNIKDQNGRILKNYDYNYASEAAVWTDNGGRRCKSGSATGEQERQETDTNPVSPTYSQTRWVSNGTNTAACQLPATVYVRMTVGSTSISNGLTYNAYVFNSYLDETCTITYNVPSSLTVNYRYVTSQAYADGRSPNPVVTTTNTPITIAAGMHQATGGSIPVSGCFGINEKQICYSTVVTLQPGAGYVVDQGD